MPLISRAIYDLKTGGLTIRTRPARCRERTGKEMNYRREIGRQDSVPSDRRTALLLSE